MYSKVPDVVLPIRPSLVFQTSQMFPLPERLEMLHDEFIYCISAARLQDVV